MKKIYKPVEISILTIQVKDVLTLSNLTNEMGEDAAGIGDVIFW